MDLELIQSKQVPILFFKNKGKKLNLIDAKIVDDLKFTRVRNNARDYLQFFKDNFKLGTVRTGADKMRFLGITTVRNDD